VGIVGAGTLLLANNMFVLPTHLVMVGEEWVIAIILFQQTALMLFLVNVVMEKQYRREFADKETASFLAWQAEKRKHEQAVLLQAMVPHHVIPDLMQWLQTEMLPSDAPSKHFPKMCVAFLKFCGPRTSAQQTAPAPQPASPALVDFDDDGASEEGNEETCGGKTTSAAIQKSSPPQGMEQTFEWLAPAHNKMDEIIDQFPSIDKVKTIGETVMVAGPFQEKYSCVEAADQLLAAMTMMQQEAQVQVGLHVGEIVGSIVGNNRICFDIFGDAVNVSSRAMTGGPKGKIQVTEEFYQEYTTGGEGDHAHSQGAVFSDPETQAAKGKGFLTVRQVVSTCQDGQEDH
jgi:class 3 adenylate cyclase